MTDYQAVIVLGGGVDSEGNLPAWVQERLRLTLTLSQEFPQSSIVLSGFGSDPGLPMSEAAAMQRFLIKAGLNQQRTVLEEQSINTLENAYYSRLILDQRSWKSFIVVTSRFHRERSQGIFEWIFGEGYTMRFESAVNAGMSEDALSKRENLERAMDKYHREKLYAAAENGDLERIGKILLNPEHPVLQAYHHFIDELPLERTLY